MDFFTEDDWNNQNRPPAQPRDVMMTASVILSVIAIMTTCCIYASLVFGALSIILALLARGQQKKLSPQGRLAVMTSTSAIVISVIATVFLFFAAIQQYGSIENFLRAYSQIMESMGGTSLFDGTGI